MTKRRGSVSMQSVWKKVEKFYNLDLTRGLQWLPEPWQGHAMCSTHFSEFLAKVYFHP